MSDCPILHTGQAVVLREVALGLHNSGKYEVVVFAWGYNGTPHQFPFTMLPASARDFGRGGIPEAGIPGLEQIVDRIKPDIVWTVADIWMVNYIAELKNRATFKWIAYTPIDGLPILDYWHPWFENVDQLVMETKFGMDEVGKANPNLDLTYIYHGCKSEIFRPLSVTEKVQIRAGITYAGIKDENNIEPRRGLPIDAFVVGVVARNQPRKNFDKTLKAFAIFAKDKPNARLWLHTSPVDQGYNLVQLSCLLGIKDKVCFTPNYSIVQGLSETDLNIVMNTFDVHLLPTQGEGFGIPIVETMAAGVPQVVSDYTSHVEFAKEGGIMIPCEEYDDFITGMPHPVERAIPKPTEMAKILNTLYADVELKRKLSQGARAKAETMTWASTIPQWLGVVEKTLSNPPRAERLPLEIITY
jgi:glycosyltransferase involved in cell wall biosynthesis